jgi:hypothetical protein
MARIGLHAVVPGIHLISIADPQRDTKSVRMPGVTGTAFVLLEMIKTPWEFCNALKHRLHN